MKTKFILLIFLIIIAQATDAQIMFQKHYGGSADDGGSSVLQTDDGGYLIVAQTFSFGIGTSDIYIIKTNAYGNEIWSKVYGGNGWDAPFGIITASNNCYIIVGETSSFGAGASDAFMMKIDSNGDSLWFKTYGGIEDDGAYGITNSTDGGYILCGTTCSFASQFAACYLIKTDSIGDTIWTRTIDKNFSSRAYSIIETNTGGYILVGRTDPFSIDGLVIMTNSLGDSIWTKTYGGNSYDIFSSICKDNNGNYLLCGTTNSFGAGDYDGYLVKINSSGDELWQKTIGGINADYTVSISYTNDNSFIITGSTQSYGVGGKDVLLLKINQDGDTLWSKTFGGISEDVAGCVLQTNDNGFIITGYTKSYSASSDVYLIKTDVSGFSGIEDINSKKESFLVYPNPNNGTMNIEYSIPETESGMFVLMDALGRMVYSKEFEGGKNTISLTLNNLNAGIYYYRAKTESRIIAGDKIIILAK